jgi:rhodanese-related sulfurtransferase
MQEITVQELRQKIENKEIFTLIDVREPHEYQEFNIGGKLMPLGTLHATYLNLEEQKEEEIIINCRSGARSAQATGFLMAQGFTNVKNLKGGVLAWIDNYGI